MKDEDCIAHNLKFMSPFLKWCNILAIVPPFNLKNKDLSSTLYKCYALVLAACSIYGYIFSLHGKFTILLQYYDYTMLIIDNIFNFFSVLLSVMVTILTTFVYHEDIKSLLIKVSDLDNCINLVAAKRRRIFWQILTIHNVLLAIALFVDIHGSARNLGWSFSKYYLCENLQFYQTSMAMFFIFYLALEIQFRCKFLNGSLKMTVRTKSANERNDNTLNCSFGADLKLIRRQYNNICEVVDIFNRVFGYILLAQVLFTIVVLLNYTGTFIVYGFNKRQIEGVTLGFDLFLICAFWFIVAVLQTLGLAVSCDGLAKEAANTAQICYVLLNDIPTLPKTDCDKIVKEELLLIAQQAVCRSPYISAARFFPINYTMFGFIVASLTSHVIILIQFVD